MMMSRIKFEFSLEHNDLITFFFYIYKKFDGVIKKFLRCNNIGINSGTKTLCLS